MSRATYHWDHLPSGPRLAVATLPDSECAALTIHIPAGSRDEDSELAGLAHFVEHMVFKGTTTRSARELSIELENAGCQVNACTSEDQTTYDARGDAESLPVLTEILCDMVWRSTFPEAEIDLERDVIGEEITMYRESPADHIGDLISQALWHGHPLGHPISGSHESISRIGLSELTRFRDLHHFRKDVVIAIAGPFSWEQAARALEAHIPPCLVDPSVRKPFAPSSATPGHIIESRDTEQVQLSMAWHTPGRTSPDRHALRLFSMMLGETASSRLFLELREELGLCYQISSDVSLFDETGTLEIHAGLDPDGVDEAKQRILAHIQSLATVGPTPGELPRAQRLAIAQGRLGMESTASHASWAGESLLDFGHIPDPAEWRSQVLSVTDAAIREAASRLLGSAGPAIAEIRPA
jgi:predicted Zn-dependent peptidase